MCCILFNSHTVFSEEEEKDFKLLSGNTGCESVSVLCVFTYISMAMYADHRTTKTSQFDQVTLTFQTMNATGQYPTFSVVTFFD